MKKTKIVYFGSPDFSAEILTYLINDPAYLIVGVVTNPDRPTGRHQTLTPSPVAQVALKHHLPTFKPVKLDEDNRIHISLLQPDLFITAAYGKFVPNSWLATPHLAPLNIHFSLLPRYRGALCISQALKNGDQETGVTLMEMDHELDHGNLIAQVSQEIDIDDNVETLAQKLTDKAKKLIDEALPLYTAWKETGVAPSTVYNLQSTIYLPPKAQDESQAVITPGTQTRNRQGALVAWDLVKMAQEGREANRIHNLIRSLNPDPGAWTEIIDPEQNKIQLKLVKTQLVGDKMDLVNVQVPGRSIISWKQFVAGHPFLG